ncbi:MAG: hypothetical protein U1F68_01890 [Gammaproteobacteria bacterium]
MPSSPYSADEMFLLASLPSMIGSAIAFSAKSGAFGTLKEALANVQSIVEAVKAYPHNALIQSLLPQMENRQEALAKAKQYREMAMKRMQEKQIDSAAKLRQQTLDDIHVVVELLRSKAAPAEAAEYKEWALSVAEQVAMAAKEGGFLGFGGERVSADEKALLAEIAGALGLQSKLA